MSTTAPKAPVNRFVAFVLGFGGFLLFAFVAFMVITINRNSGTAYEDTLAETRNKWKAESDAAQASVKKTAWKDEAAGIAQVSAADYLPIAAKSLLSPANAPKARTDDAAIVPGTPTFEAYAQKQAAAAAAPAPTPPAPTPDSAPATNGQPAPAPTPTPAPGAQPTPVPAPAPVPNN